MPPEHFNEENEPEQVPTSQRPVSIWKELGGGVLVGLEAGVLKLVHRSREIWWGRLRDHTRVKLNVPVPSY